MLGDLMILVVFFEKILNLFQILNNTEIIH